MYSYDELQAIIKNKLLKTTRLSDVNLALAKIIQHATKTQWVKVDLEKLQESLWNEDMFNIIMLNYIKNYKQLSIIVYKDTLTKKLLWYDLVTPETRDKALSKAISLIPWNITYDTMPQVSLSIKGRQLIEIVVCPTFSYEKSLEFNHLDVNLYLKIAKYTEEELDAIGDFYADLLPILQQIEDETENNIEW